VRTPGQAQPASREGGKDYLPRSRTHASSFAPVASDFLSSEEAALMLSVLIVEDASNIRTQLVRFFGKRWSCYQVEAAGGVREARAALMQADRNLVLLDLGLPTAARQTDADWRHGRELLRWLKGERPHTKVIILSTHGELVRDFLKEEGADDFFLKDHREDWLGDKLPSQVERLIGHLGCRSEAGQRLRDDLAKLGPDVHAAVLEGQAGSGRKHAARVLHQNSRRANLALLVLPTQHLRAETFLADMAGEAGALPVPGLLEGDTTGTIVLDELQYLRHADPLVQSSLAQLLSGAEAGCLRFTPIGGTQPRGSPCCLVLCVEGQLSGHLESSWMVPELARELRKLPVVSTPSPQERMDDLGEIVETIRRRCNDRRRDNPVIETEPAAVEALEQAMKDGRLDNLADLDAVICAACRRAEGHTLTAEVVGQALPQAKRSGKALAQTFAPLLSRPVAIEAYRRMEQTFLESADVASRMQHLDRLAALGQMVSGVVHELGSPMTAILAAASTMESQQSELTPQQTAEMTQILCEESRRMRRMIEDLRHFSRSGEADELQETDLEDLVTGAVKLVRLEPRAKYLRISVQTRTAISPLRLYHGRVKQVLLNLLRNAVDAVDEKSGAIEVALAEDDARVLLSIRDDGAGMTPEVAERIWEPFFTTKGEHGTGIGLDIARKIVEAHGGTIAVESAPGEGTTFTIALPRQS